MANRIIFVIGSVSFVQKLLCHQLSVRPLWSLRYFRPRGLPTPLVVFTIAATVAGEREHREFLGITTGAQPIAVPPGRCEALHGRRHKRMKMRFVRRLEGHREQLVWLARRGRGALSITTGGGGPDHFMGMRVAVVGRWMMAKGLTCASI